MFYKIVCKIVYVFCFIFLGFKKPDESHLPKTGGVIICANHSSFWDAPILAIGLSRRMVFMAKDTLFRFKPFGKLITLLGAFPVKRDGSDFSAVRDAITLIKNENALLIFPQGTRCSMENPVDAKMGAIKIAQITGAPILPVGINEKFGLFCGTRIKIGEPVYYKRDKSLTDEDINKMCKDLMDTIYDLAKNV